MPLQKHLKVHSLPTEALTVIDVNTGKNIAKKEMQENFLKVNIEAAEEIARQLRLRNISGIVIVDFINLEAKSAESELLNVFGAALKKDPVPLPPVLFHKVRLTSSATAVPLYVPENSGSNILRLR